VFSDLLLKAHRDVSIARRRAAACESKVEEAEKCMVRTTQQAATQIEALQKTVDDQQEEATRLELEASKPLWQWADAVRDLPFCY